MDDKNQRFKAQRNQEPPTIDTTITGQHATGNYQGGTVPDQGKLPPLREAEVWIEQDDHAKQRMARKLDLKAAQAAPDHPHIGKARGSGEIQ
jgi:hypothetical protein